LVDELSELPAEEASEFIEYAEVMGTYNPADAALIKSILDSENITYYFNADHFMQVSPLAEPVRVMVKKDEVEKAKELLQGLNLSILAIDLRKAERKNEDE